MRRLGKFLSRYHDFKDNGKELEDTSTENSVRKDYDDDSFGAVGDWGGESEDDSH